MQKEYNIQEDAEKVKEEFSRMLLMDLQKYKSLNKKMHPNENYRYESSGLYAGYSALANNIHNAREALKNTLKKDQLIEKVETAAFTDGQTYCWFENPEGDRSYYRDDNYYNKEKSATINAYIIVENDRTVYASSLVYWKDELLSFIKSKGKTVLHDKLEYIRIGDEFFSRGKYFSFKGQVFEKNKWAVDDGQLVDLTKSIRVDVSTANVYSMQQRIGFSKTYYLNAEEGEEFENLAGKVDKGFACVKIYTASNIHRFFGGDFLTSMFISGNKRFHNNGYTYMYLTKEQMMDLKCEPSMKHKELFAKIENDYAATFYKYSGNQFLRDRFRDNVQRSISFAVEIDTGMANGIKEQIYKELFGPAGNCKILDIDELNKHLKILQEILAKEKEYAKNS